MLSVNDTAPSFTSLNQQGQEISLSDYRGKKVVLYFYPKDDTPGCTIEANEFTALATEFMQNNTVVIGVSKDSCESHQAFIDKYGLKVDLLADTRGEICEAYSVWQEKNKNGVTSMGIVRSTFVIDETGQLIDVEYGVTAEGHAAQILEKVKSA